MTHALEALGGTKPTKCRNTTFPIKDHDDYLVQFNNTLSIGVGGILSLMLSFGEHDPTTATEITAIYIMTFAPYRKQFPFMNDVGYAGIPPSWSLSWAFRHNKQTCNLTFEIAHFDDLLLEPPGEVSILQANTEIFFSTGAQLDSNIDIDIHWVNNTQSISTSASLVPETGNKVTTRISPEMDWHGVWFAAVVRRQTLVDIDDLQVLAGPAVVRFA